MGSIINILLENWTVVLLAVAGLFVLLCLISESLRAQLKKGVIFLLILLGIGLGYYFLTGKSPSEIPGDVNRFFGGSHVQDETTKRYYRVPEER